MPDQSIVIDALRRELEEEEDIALDCPLDLDEMAYVMAGPSSDQFHQEDLLTRSLGDASPHDADYRRTFDGTASLSLFGSAYNSNDKNFALAQLQRRTMIKYDNESLDPMNPEAMVWNMNKHYLDMLVAVSSSLGLWAIMPDVIQDIHYEFKLVPGKHFRDYKVKRAMLGFDPTGRMLWLGTSREEDVWLAMCPVAVTRGHILAFGDAPKNKSTRLSTAHYRMVMAFMISCLDDLQTHPIFGNDLYKIPLSGPIVWSHYTNVL